MSLFIHHFQDGGFLNQSKKFAKIRLSTTCGFKLDFCCAARIILAHMPFGLSPAKTLRRTNDGGFQSELNL